MEYFLPGLLPIQNSDTSVSKFNGHRLIKISVAFTAHSVRCSLIVKFLEKCIVIVLFSFYNLICYTFHYVMQSLLLVLIELISIHLQHGTLQKRRRRGSEKYAGMIEKFVVPIWFGFARMIYFSIQRVILVCLSFVQSVSFSL